MLLRLSVRGFESIRTPESFEPDAVNVLIGGNGAGKSSIVGLFAPADALAREKVRRSTGCAGGSAP